MYQLVRLRQPIRQQTYESPFTIPVSAPTSSPLADLPLDCARSPRISISETSGVATKTSYALFLNVSISESRSNNAKARERFGL